MAKAVEKPVDYERAVESKAFELSTTYDIDALHYVASNLNQRSRAPSDPQLEGHIGCDVLCAFDHTHPS